MPVWPKSFLAFGTGIQTALTAFRLRQKRSGPGAQRSAFEFLRRQLAATSYWRQAGVESGMRYEDFRTRVAPRGHPQLVAAIERMQKGEADVLWPGPCQFFAATSGTSTGQGRLFPVTAALLAHFRRSVRESLFYYTARVGHVGVLGGRHLMLSGSTALTPLPTRPGNEAYSAELGGIIELSLSPSAERHWLEPGPDISRMREGLAKFDATAARTVKQDITLLAGLPNWVLQFAEALREATTPGQDRVPNLQALWPNLECVIHGGIPIAPFQRELRLVLGPKVKFHEVYPACEAFIGAQDAEPAAGIRLMADNGVFFEFLPAAGFDESRLAESGSKAVPLADVKAGVDYVPLLTTPGGLARHLLGDVIRFVSTTPPRFVYRGRTGLNLAAFGEHVVERELSEALLAVCERHEWSLANFHVAPRFDSQLTSQNRGGHEWWIELRPGIRRTPIGPQLGAEIDQELQRINADYASRRQAGTLAAPVVRLVMPGVFEHWLRFRGQWGGQNKSPRCRNDRLVADELGQVTNFAQD